MNFKKISAALSAIVMGTTMMAGMAMNASAYTFTDASGSTVDGGFYAYYDTDDDGTSEWAVAPTKMGIDMYDATIDDVTDNDDGTYTIALKTAGNTATSGTVTSIKASESGTNIISNNSVTLEEDTVYYMTVEAQLFGVTVHTSTMQIKFVVE